MKLKSTKKILIFIFLIGFILMLYLNYTYEKRRMGFEKLEKDFSKKEVIKLMGQPDYIQEKSKNNSQWNYALYLTPFVNSGTIYFEKNKVDTFYIID